MSSDLAHLDYVASDTCLMDVLCFLLLLVALICFALGSFPSRPWRVDLIALGLAFMVAVPLLQMVGLGE